MANNYYSIKNHSTNGNSNISFKVFEDIVENVIVKSRYARLPIKRNNQDKTKPIRCQISKNNLVYINADIALKKGKDIKKTCDELIDEIKNTILLFCETKPIVNINVSEIDL